MTPLNQRLPPDWTFHPQSSSRKGLPAGRSHIPPVSIFQLFVADSIRDDRCTLARLQQDSGAKLHVALKHLLQRTGKRHGDGDAGIGHCIGQGQVADLAGGEIGIHIDDFPVVGFDD